MSVSIWSAWAAESVTPSLAMSSTSPSFSASLRAFSVIAAIQPWSAPGALKAILTGPPSPSVPAAGVPDSSRGLCGPAVALVVTAAAGGDAEREQLAQQRQRRFA